MGQIDLINKHFPDDEDYTPRRVIPLSRVTALLLIAVIGFGALLYFGYSTPHEENGELPVVTADESPVKSRPDDPGGMEIPHQDATIYDEMNPDAQKKAEIEQLLPAAEEPIAPPPAAETASNAGAPEAAVQPALEDNLAIVEETPANTPASPANTAPKTAAVPVEKAPAAPRTVASTPKPDRDPVLAQEPKIIESKPVAAAPPPPASKPAAIAATPVPSPKTVSVPAASSINAVTPAEKMPAGSSVGRYRIQLASVGSEQAARSEWQRLAQKNSDVLNGLTANFEQASIPGKGTFFRIQAGSVDQTKAKNICNLLKARSQNCMVVAPR